jgi:UDP-N-acetylglucosamine--N-acetylmuramyl-(pentapeptide) pyrophosphoryl-undecaprenol N-acetylglucosamine transferase
LPSLPNKENVFKKYNLDLVNPLTLIFGGGTGSISINEAVKNNLAELLEVTQIIHVSGVGKLIDESRPGYVSVEFLNHLDLISVMAVSDIIVARPGLGTLTELSALKKASILVPMPNSHQEDNASACADSGAAIYIEQKDLESKLVRVVTELLNSEDKRKTLETQMATIIKSGAADAIVDISYKLIK